MDRLCDHCLALLAPSVTTDDLALLDYLQRTRYTTPQFAAAREELQAGVIPPPTAHTLRESLVRLQAIGLVGANARGKATRFYLLPSGAAMYQLLKESL